MNVHVESKDDILERKCDGRGRVTLGSGFANERVVVAVLDRNPRDQDGEEGEE